jgi:nitrate reductase NapD
MNICSLIIHTQAKSDRQVARQLESIGGVQVHGGDDMGRLIVTVEETRENQASIAETISELQDVAGVINTILIYHYDGDETWEEMNREID